MLARLIFMVAVMGGTPAMAADVTVAGQTFPADVDTPAGELPRVGAGIAWYGPFIKVYTAALYCPSDIPRERLLAADTPRQIEIAYLRELDADVLVEAANKVLKRQLSNEALAGLRERVERFHSWYRDVAEGDRFTMRYIPGEGTTLIFNGEALGTVSGADFAAA
ncbi:MAG: chalcone isomerase family protein, partial [Ectothiorhodospiraceae bacterium]